MVFYSFPHYDNPSQKFITPSRFHARAAASKNTPSPANGSMQRSETWNDLLDALHARYPDAVCVLTQGANGAAAIDRAIPGDLPLI
jgi:hypothetical protein